MNEKTRRLTLMAMLSALAYIVMLVGRIPVVMFLKYDPKDVVLAVGGFLLGPLPGAAMSTLVSLVEMFTASETGPIGFLMNALSSCAFIVPAAWTYRRDRSLKGAAIGLVAGVICMTGIMLAWNYIVTPLYMGYPRAAVAELLIPVFLPFNAGKGALNAGITMLIYKPVSQALRRAKLLPAASETSSPRRFSLTATLISAFVIVTAAVCFYLLSRS